MTPSDSDGSGTPGGTDATTRRRLLAAGATAAAAGLAGCSLGTGSLKTDRTTKTFSAPAGTPVLVRNDNGDVRLRPMGDGARAADTTTGTAAATTTTGDGGAGGDGGSDGGGEGTVVEVEIVKRTRGPEDRFGDVEVLGEVNDFTLQVETFYRGSLTKPQVSVDLTVRVAAGHAVERASTGNGDVELRDLPGDATLTTGNGDVIAQNVDGYPKLETGNGDCEATGTTGLRGATTGNGDCEVEVRAMQDDVTCRSGNGDVEVGVPTSLDAEAVLDVGNGESTVEGVDLADRSASDDGTRISGRLGEGGPRLRLTTGNGDVRLYGLDG